MSEALFEADELIAVPTPTIVPTRASELTLTKTTPSIARRYVAAWHSRLPTTQIGPWKLAFTAEYRGEIFGAALWHNPSARLLPQDWLELRRLAVPEYAPHCTASWMLGAMRRWIRNEQPDVPRLCSYQDSEVHNGTIYRAAGWEDTYRPVPINRNRADKRNGRLYRSDINGSDVAAAAKIRWEITP